MTNYDPQVQDNNDLFQVYEEQPVSQCCKLGQKGKLCLCERTIYLVRPYVYELLRGLQPFFEIIGYSSMKDFILKQIIDHIENVLNKPVIELFLHHSNQVKEIELKSLNSNQSIDSKNKC